MKKIFIGIDFSKEKFDATVIKAEGVEECAQRQHEVFDNKVSGFRRLLRWVKSVADEPDTGLWLFCGENTGGYSKALCNFLYGSGYDMWLENALSIKRSSALQRVKSDKADSGIIAEYAMRNYDQMRLYKPLGRNLERLREVFLYRHNLVKLKVCITLRKGEKQLTQEKSDISRFMAMSSKHLISEFNKKIAECDKRIQQIIDEDEELQRNFEIITSVPGVGAQNAVCLMVYTDNFSRFDYDSRKIACYYGVAPFGRQSGTSVNTPAHVSPFANKLIKSLLTQAALASVNFCPQMAIYYHRLLEAGKKKPVAVNNVKNKLLHVITAMVRKGEKYNPDYDYHAAINAA
ncbi:MAG: IS110 family transposase [Prevotella sp.]|nr:IS110 family transposase [Prevotella sp.]